MLHGFMLVLTLQHCCLTHALIVQGSDCTRLTSLAFAFDLYTGSQTITLPRGSAVQLRHLSIVHTVNRACTSHPFTLSGAEAANLLISLHIGFCYLGIHLLQDLFYATHRDGIKFFPAAEAWPCLSTVSLHHMPHSPPVALLDYKALRVLDLSDLRVPFPDWIGNLS